MLNTFEMDGKRYIILPYDSVELFDNWLVGQNLRLAEEEEKRLTRRAADGWVCHTCGNHNQTRYVACWYCSIPPTHR